MKMKKVFVTFEKRMTVEVCMPEDMHPDSVGEIAQDLAEDGLSNWDVPEWESYVGRVVDVDVPDSELTLGPPNKYGFRLCQSPMLNRGLVINDAQDDIVDPVDATWWVKGQ